MKKTFIIVFAFILGISNVNGQEFESVKQLDNKKAKSMVDNYGNLYTYGYFSSDLDLNFNTGVFNMSSEGGQDFYIQKTDADGNFLWGKSGGGEMDDYYRSAAIDSNGDILLIGSFEGTVDFDPNSGITNLSSESNDNFIQPIGYFIQKLSSDGELVWVKHLDGMLSFQDISLDIENNMFILGSYRNTVDFDPGIGNYFLFNTPGLNSELFVLKLNPLGEFLWVKDIESDAILPMATAVDSEESVYIVGKFNGTINFDPENSSSQTTSQSNNYDIFVYKLNSEGDFEWRKTCGGNGIDRANDIALDDSNNVYIVGNFTETVDFNPNSETAIETSFGSTDYFLLKLDSEGIFEWVYTNGGIFQDLGQKIAIDEEQNILISGQFQDFVQFYSVSYMSNGLKDIYVQKIDSEGIPLWQQHIGGGGFNQVNSIITTSSGIIYSTGYFGGNVDIDPGNNVVEISADDGRGFIQKLNNNLVSVEEINSISWSITPNPANEVTYINLPKDVNNAKIQIIDITGKIISSNQLLNSQYRLDLSSHSAGIYSLNITLENGQLLQRKLIIQ